MCQADLAKDLHTLNSEVGAVLSCSGTRRGHNLISARLLGHRYRARKAHSSTSAPWTNRKQHRLRIKHARAFPRKRVLGAQAPPGVAGLPAMRPGNGLIGHTSGRRARRAGGASLAARSITVTRRGVSCAGCMGQSASFQAQPPQRRRHNRGELLLHLAKGPSRRPKSPEHPRRDRDSLGLWPSRQPLRQHYCPRRRRRLRMVWCRWEEAATAPCSTPRP